MPQFILAVFAMFLASGAMAAESALDLLDSAAPYHADFSVSSPRGTYQGTVWHVHGRERRDVVTSGGGQGVLILRDSDAAYLLGLSGKWYVGLSLKAAGALKAATTVMAERDVCAGMMGSVLGSVAEKPPPGAHRSLP